MSSPREVMAKKRELDALKSGLRPHFDRLMFERLDRTLDLYLDAARQAQEFSAAWAKSSR